MWQLRTRAAGEEEGEAEVGSTFVFAAGARKHTHALNSAGRGPWQCGGLSIAGQQRGSSMEPGQFVMAPLPRAEWFDVTGDTEAVGTVGSAEPGRQTWERCGADGLPKGEKKVRFHLSTAVCHACASYTLAFPMHSLQFMREATRGYCQKILPKNYVYWDSSKIYFSQNHNIIP